MSEEEKQAIDNLKYSTTMPSNETINTILNLIDKQEKEIEVVTKSYDKALDMLVDKDNKIKEKMQEIINYTYNSEEEKLRQEYAYDRLKELLGEEDE